MALSKSRLSNASLLIPVALLLCACHLAEPDIFAIYLVNEDIPTEEARQTPLNQFELEEIPLITDAGITTYSAASHELELTQSAYERILELQKNPRMDVDGMPFVICVGNTRIYMGAFWTPISSLTFDSVVIMLPFDTDKRTINITLGYPASWAFTGFDPRSDQRILNALKTTGKLK